MSSNNFNGKSQSCENQLISIKIAANYLGICERKLWELTMPRGDIPCIEIGRSIRYDMDDLKNWVQEHKRKVQ
ncbi:MAG: helix-turn-helix domain-containing protein [Phycisphaerae bacterium]|nr:helix-turn-helix domain-containing protein [Phycisphaerae bacterium]